MKTPEQRALTVQQDDRLLIYLLGGSFAGAGLFILMFLGSIMTCMVDKAIGTSTLKQQGLLGTKVIEHQIWEIAGIRVEELKYIVSGTYRIGIVMRSGECLPLTRYYTGKRHHQETAA